MFVIGVALGSTLFGTKPAQTNTVATSSIAVGNSSQIYATFLKSPITCCGNTNEGGALTYSLSIEYNGGPWMMHYWIQNYQGTEISFQGHLNGTGNTDIWIKLPVIGVAEYTLCASGTPLPNDLPQYYPLTVTLFNQNATNTRFEDTVLVCGSMGI